MKNQILSILFFMSQVSFGQRISIGQLSDSFYIYKNDSLLLTTGFTEVAAFSEGKTWVNVGEKYAYLDSSGAYITDYKYDVVSRFENNFAAVAVDSLFGFINAQGDEITAMKYDRVRNFENGFALVQLDELWGLIDTSGSEVVDPSADLPLINISDRDYFAMKYHGFWGIVNSKGKIIIPFIYDCILPDGTAYKNNDSVKLNLPETQE